MIVAKSKIRQIWTGPMLLYKAKKGSLARLQSRDRKCSDAQVNVFELEDRKEGEERLKKKEKIKKKLKEGSHISKKGWGPYIWL